jgi:transposase
VIRTGGPTMLTAVTEEDWTIVLQVFDASRSRGGDKGRDLEALHYFVVHNITWRALPEKLGHWNSVWKRFWRLSRTGTFEAFFDALAAMSETAHLVQMFDSTVVRAHVSAAGAKGVKRTKRSAVRAAVSRRKST